MLAAMVGEAAARSDPGMSFSTYSITLNSILYQLGLLGLRAEWRFWARQLIPQDDGGEGGIRTPGRGLSPYNGLANLSGVLIGSENFGLYYISQADTTQAI
jgi:hypothetical protein